MAGTVTAPSQARRGRARVGSCWGAAPEGVLGCSWSLRLLGCQRDRGPAHPQTLGPGREHPGRRSLPQGHAVWSGARRNLPKLCPLRHRNLALSLVVRKELMAEAAASEKGLSAEEKVRETPQFLSCADGPGYLKPKQNPQTFLRSAQCLVLSPLGPHIPGSGRGSCPLCFRGLLHLPVDRCSCKEGQEGKAHPRSHPVGKRPPAGCTASPPPLLTCSVAWVPSSTAAATPLPSPCKISTLSQRATLFRCRCTNAWPQHPGTAETGNSGPVLVLAGAKLILFPSSRWEGASFGFVMKTVGYTLETATLGGRE